MHQYIKFLNDIANHPHHYFSVVHHYHHYSLADCGNSLLVLVIITIIVLGFVAVFYHTKSVVCKAASGVIMIFGLLLMLISIYDEFDVSRISVKANISQVEINRYVDTAHKECPYLVTVKQDKFLHHSTTNYLASNVKGGVVHNAIKIHNASDTIQPKYVIKHYIEPIDGASQISYTDSRAYFKHKVKQNIENEKDILSE